MGLFLTDFIHIINQTLWVYNDIRFYNKLIESWLEENKVEVYSGS